MAQVAHPVLLYKKVVIQHMHRHRAEQPGPCLWSGNLNEWQGQQRQDGPHQIDHGKHHHAVTTDFDDRVPARVTQRGEQNQQDRVSWQRQVPVALGKR